MGSTQHFGLQKFGSEGRISDEGYKFSSKDRDTLDVLLYQLFQHDHQDTTGTGALDGPGFTATLSVANSGGTLVSGTSYWYKIAYVDSNGSETIASPAAIATTDAALGAPPVMALSTATTGGTLDPGTYKYALSYYQSSGGETTAPNIASIVVPVGTSTNTVTVTLDSLPSGANGWKVYRKAPGEVQYYLLKTVASGATQYVDDGSDSPDCSITRPTSNSTNASNSVTISINSNDLPLDSRVTSWRIYRSKSANFGERSLIATQTETTTEGGSDLITTYTDTGGAGQAGIPLNQTTVPPNIPQLSAGDVFQAGGKPLEPEFAPRAVSVWSTFISGNVTNGSTYNQTVPPYDSHVKRVDVFFQNGGPTGVDGSNYTTIRIADDSLVDEVQEVYTDAVPTNEIQNLSNNATGGTFTISFDGQGPTNALNYDAPVLVVKDQQSLYNNATGGTFTLGDGTDTTSSIAYNAAAATIKTRLETDITAITTVTVTGTGVSSDPWIITIDDPAGPFVEFTVTDSLTGGTSTITTLIEGLYGVETELEKLSNITDVDVTGSGIAADPWVIEFVNPGSQDVAAITTNDASLTGGTSTVSTAVQGSTGGTFTLSDGTDTTSAIAYDASAATVETRLQTDITSITDVTVTGAGTLASPWVITFVNPGDQDVDQLIGDGTNLSAGANVYVSTTTEGRGNTQIDVLCQTATDFFSWTSPSTASGEQEADASPATGGAVVSDTLAGNDYAAELDAQNEENYWNVGTLDPGDYVASFHVSDIDGTTSFDIEVVDDHLGTPTLITSSSHTPAGSSVYEVYTLKFTADGTEDIFFVTTKTDTGTDRVRVDRYEYEVNLPRLWAGQNATVEGVITGSPTTPGADVQVNVWY